MKTILKFLCCIILTLVFFVLAFLIYMTSVDYAPGLETVVANNDKPTSFKVGDTISCMSWNIGYAGLDKGMDFFYDGGTQVRPTEERSLDNLHHIAKYLTTQKCDFFLIQEIDVDAKRSYGRNQLDTIGKGLKMIPYFGMNYSVKWVPLPVFEPMGRVESGIALYTASQPSSVSRYSYPVNFKWPLKVFMLDRCFLVSRFPTSNNKELLVINTHNSAFDSGGELRKAELNFLKDYLESEYKNGNYVILGGDFNQCPAGFKPAANNNLFDYEDFHTVPDTLLSENWHYVYDTIPTNRRVIAAYDPLTTKTTLIDFFITSPNVECVSVKVDDLAFEYSDHNPVIGSFVLK